MSFEITLNKSAGTIGIKATIGGNVFGQPAPKPEDLTATIGSSGTFSYTSAVFGKVTVTVALDAAGGGKVTMSAPDVPSARIASFTGISTISSPTSMGFTYTVTFRDGTAPAQGTGTLTRTPG